MTPSPEKSVVQEAEALPERLRRIADAGDRLFGTHPQASHIIKDLRDAATALAEQHRLEAENRSLREARQDQGDVA